MSRKNAIAFMSLIALALVGFALDPKGLRHSWRLLADVQRIEAENRSLMEGNERLRVELRRLAGDPAALERAAREELGLVRPGEVVFRLEGGDEIQEF